jgi:serine/threonine-protein kinase
MLAGTEEGHSPFFSPDGRWIAFFADGKLRKISVNGGPVFDICDVSADRGGVWLDDGSIILATHATRPLSQVTAAGGAPHFVTALDTTQTERTHRWPDVLPGGEWVIFTIGDAHNPGNYENASIGAINLRTHQRRLVLKGASMAHYCDPGYLLFSRQGALFSVPIDADNAKVEGDAVPVLDHVDGEASSGGVHFAVSRNGTLAFVPRVEGSEHADLVWVTMDGTATLVPTPPHEFLAPRISPDGKQISVTIGQGYGSGDIYRYDIARQTLTRVTFDGRDLLACWTPDGRALIAQNENVDFFISKIAIDSDASPQTIHVHHGPLVLGCVTPDGRDILFAPWGTTSADLMKVPLAGGDATTLFEEPLDQADAIVSPDGAWMAYDSRGNGVPDVFVRSYPPGPNKWQISTGGGSMPLWNPVRKELYWMAQNAIFAASYGVNNHAIEFERPRKLFDLPPGRGVDADVRNYDISPDGTRFLMTRIARPEFARRRVDVVLDFDAQLKSLEKKGISQ